MSETYTVSLVDHLDKTSHDPGDGAEVDVYAWANVVVSSDSDTVCDDNGMEIGDPDEAIEYATEIISAALLLKRIRG